MLRMSTTIEPERSAGRLSSRSISSRVGKLTARRTGTMPHFICTTCGTQHAKGDQPPATCAVCQDERQYVKATGQQWTTLERLRLTNRNSIKFEEPGLIGVGIEPHFAIGQRALFLRTPKANVLWDCLALLD